MMNGFKLLALVAMTVPAIAMAQVGPNPAVSGGSQDPTLRGSVDTTTSPQDARIGTGPTGNVLDRPIDTPTRPAVDTMTTTDATVSTDGTATTATTAETKTTTKPMKARRPR